MTLPFVEATRATWRCQTRRAVGGSPAAIDSAQLEWLGSRSYRSSRVQATIENATIQAELVDGEAYELLLESEGLAPFRRVFRFDAKRAGEVQVAEFEAFGSPAITVSAPPLDLEQDESLVVRFHGRSSQTESAIQNHWGLQPNHELSRNQDLDQLAQKGRATLERLRPGIWRTARTLWPGDRAWIADPQFVTVSAGGQVDQVLRFVPGVELTLEIERPAGRTANPLIELLDGEGRSHATHDLWLFEFIGLGGPAPIEWRVLPDRYRLRATWTDDATSESWTAVEMLDLRGRTRAAATVPDARAAHH